MGLIGYFVVFTSQPLNPKTESKSSKVSKDSDFYLVSNKNLSKILPSSGLGLGSDEVDQKGLKLLHL